MSKTKQSSVFMRLAMRILPARQAGPCRSFHGVEMGGPSPSQSRPSCEGGALMNTKTFLALAVAVMVVGLVAVNQREAQAGEVTPPPGYKVLEPIRHGNLTVFPVVAGKSYPTGEFMTLDEGLRSGDVVVTEAGNVQGLIRRHSTSIGSSRWRAGEPAGPGKQFQATAALAGR